MTRARDLAAFVSNADGDIKFDTDTLFIDSSANRVGIQSNSPNHVLDARSSATGAIPTDASMGASSENDNYVSIFNSNNSATYGGLAFETRTSGASRWLIANEWQEFYKGDLVFRTRDGGSSSSESIRILNEGGITFNGDTAAANALDDYEEGFAPLTISGSTGGSTTYAENDAASRVRYTKIGRLVHASFLMNNQTFPSYSGLVQIGLPFASSSTGSYECRSGDVYFYNTQWDGVTNFVGLTLKIGTGSSIGFLGVNQLDSNRQLNLSSTNSSLSGTAGLYMRINITYETD